jgi:succinyl-CoA synthetase beta subunit
VRKVLVAQAAEIARELYLSIVLDRAKKLPLIMFSSEGGVGHREVARTAPEKIVRRHIPLDGLRPLPGARAVPGRVRERRPGEPGGRDSDEAVARVPESDCSLAEINPLAVTPAGRGAGARRQGDPRRQRRVPSPRVGFLARRRRRDRGQRLAREKGLSYVKLDGESAAS